MDSPLHWASLRSMLRAMLPLVFGVALVGCATPSPIVRLNPLGNDIVWVGGRASVQKEDTGVRVATAFEHQDGGTLGLRVEIENGTVERLDVSSQNLTFSTCIDKTVASCAPSQRVIDPEHVLAALDVAQSRGTADAINNQAFLGTMVLLSAVGDVSAIASGHAHSSTGLNTVVAANAMEGDAAARDSTHAAIAVQRQIWSDQALRRNTIYPGQGTAGLVFVPINLKARYVWLQVRVAGRLFPFQFEQVVTPIDPVAAMARGD